MACLVMNAKGQILILKRSPEKILFPNKWFVVAAAPLSKDDDMEFIALREVKDELGVRGKIIRRGRNFEFSYQGEKWIIATFLAKITAEDLILNQEHTEMKWIEPEELKNYDTVSGTETLLNLIP